MNTNQRQISFRMVCMKDIFRLFYSWHDVIKYVIFFTSSWNIWKNINFKRMVVMWLLISVKLAFQRYMTWSYLENKKIDPPYDVTCSRDVITWPNHVAPLKKILLLLFLWCVQSFMILSSNEESWRFYVL